MYEWSDVRVVRCTRGQMYAWSNVPEVKWPKLSKGFSDTLVAINESNGSPIVGISPKKKMLFKALWDSHLVCFV